MQTQVKICGVNSREAAEATLRAGADFAGLVFHSKSPRHLERDHAKLLAELMRGRVRIVALLVSPDDSDIEAVIHAVRPDLLQLHGKEGHARVANIREKFGLPIIKAAGVADANDVVQAQKYEDVADHLLFDTKGHAEVSMGGQGAAFDWTILAGRTFRRPWFLAGGLTPQNVATAIEISGAPMVDVSTGVEDCAGRQECRQDCRVRRRRARRAPRARRRAMTALPNSLRHGPDAQRPFRRLWRALSSPRP